MHAHRPAATVTSPTIRKLHAPNPNQLIALPNTTPTEPAITRFPAVVDKFSIRSLSRLTNLRNLETLNLSLVDYSTAKAVDYFARAVIVRHHWQKVGPLLHETRGKIFETLQDNLPSSVKQAAHPLYGAVHWGTVRQASYFEYLNGPQANISLARTCAAFDGTVFKATMVISSSPRARHLAVFLPTTEFEFVPIYPGDLVLSRADLLCEFRSEESDEILLEFFVTTNAQQTVIWS